MRDSVHSTLPQAGEWIAGKYRIERVLGQGGMGTVLEAVHPDLDRRVAIKVVRQELVQNEQVVGRLMVEARSAARIRSEHATKVLDVGRLDSGAPYIVMEYLDGSDLGRVSEQRGQLPLSEAVDYVLQACEAIAEAHTAGIVHRDLKPENLFLTRRADGSPLVKVLDFGISKNLSDSRSAGLTNPSSALGSPMYMSPEQMQAAAEVDARTDIYALGAILFELLSARGVFTGDTLPAICAQVLNQPAPPLSSLRADVPSALEAIVQRCLEKDRTRRFDDVAALVTALRPFASALGSISAERVARVVQGSQPTGIISSAEFRVAPGRTEPAFVSPTGGGVAASKPPRRVGLFIAAVGTATAILVGVLYRTAGSSAQRPAELPTSSDARAGTSGIVTPPASAALAPVAVPTPTINPVAAEPTAMAADAGPPETGKSSPEPGRPANVRRGSGPAPKPAPDRAGVDAFDPNSFGDRH